jgi:hypothetical protein
MAPHPRIAISSMHKPFLPSVALALACAVLACLTSPSLAAPAPADGGLRVATFNLALYGRSAGEILARLNTGTDPQAQTLAEIIQRARPDVLVLNEFDYDAEGAVLAAFCDKYLAVGQNVSKSPGGAAEPIEFPHRMAFAANTGEHSGLDLDRNGKVDATIGSAAYSGDCWGYGIYPGEYAFAILSKYKIDVPAIRQFRKFLWKDMPQEQLPDDAATPAPADWYSPEILAQFRLSSKNHCDVPIEAPGRRIHFLLSHPTPPVFDGDEDRNGRRNHDELRFWADYISTNAPAPSSSAGRAGEGGEAGTSAVTNKDAATPPLTPPRQGEGNGENRAYMRDDAGKAGGLAAGESFIILGDLNGDPLDGQGTTGIALLINSPQVLKYPFPTSAGAVEAAKLQGGVNASHRGDPALDTEDAADERGPGNLHLDYLLPSTDLKVAATGVFWPETSDPLASLVAGAERPASSDHRLVWIDVGF